MNTKQIEELRLIWNQENGAIAFHDLLEKVEQLNQEARQQTAKEIIEMIEKDESDYDFDDDYSIAKYNMVKLIKSKYGIGEK